MELKPLASAAAALALALGGISAAQALTMVDLGQAILSYEETSDFGSITSTFGSGPNNFGFSWTVPDIVQIAGTGDLVMASFTLPSFTISAKPGYVFTGLSSFIGNIAFTEVGGAVTGILAYADVSVDGGPPVSISDGVDWQVSLAGPGFLQGYFAETSALPTSLSFSTLTVTNAYIVLSAAGGTLGTIFAQPQNVLSYSVATSTDPVPEPATYAMLLSGLAAIAWVARRRYVQVKP